MRRISYFLLSFSTHSEEAGAAVAALGAVGALRDVLCNQATAGRLDAVPRGEEKQKNLFFFFTKMLFVPRAASRAVAATYTRICFEAVE